MSTWDRVKEDLGITRTTLSTHVLDSVHGTPAAGVAIKVTRPDGTFLHGRTDADGRARVEQGVTAGEHTLTFETGEWYGETPHFHPRVEVTFTVTAGEHHHIALLLSPFAYSTYKGS